MGQKEEQEVTRSELRNAADPVFFTAIKHIRVTNRVVIHHY